MDILKELEKFFEASSEGDMESAVQTAMNFLADPMVESGLNARMIWAFVEATKNKVLPSQYQLLVAVVTEENSMEFLDKQKALYSNGWEGFSVDCHILLELFKKWPYHVLGGDRAFSPPPFPLSVVFFKDLGDMLSLYYQIAEEEKERKKLH